MVSLFLCPECGGGLPTRRGIRHHLEAHGWPSARAYTAALELDRRPAPDVWKCERCRRSFSAARGLIRHVLIARHAKPVL